MARSDEIDAMIAAVLADYRSTERWTGRPSPPERVLDALRRVPRDAFVPAAERRWAWRDTALPIGLGQTISQPYIVALMTDMLDVDVGTRVLEIGTGSGYQAAVLAELGAVVFTMEIVDELATRASQRLRQLGFDSISVRQGDGGLGWPEAAPFDRVVATAAAPSVPEVWFDQLVAGGRLLAPVGPHPQSQALMLWTLDDDGARDQRAVLPVRFVPLTGVAGR